MSNILLSLSLSLKPAERRKQLLPQPDQPKKQKSKERHAVAARLLLRELNNPAMWRDWIQSKTHVYDQLRINKLLSDRTDHMTTVVGVVSPSASQLIMIFWVSLVLFSAIVFSCAHGASKDRKEQQDHPNIYGSNCAAGCGAACGA